MTRIESRPSKTDKWDYDFFIDLDLGSNESQVETNKVELQKLTTALQVNYLEEYIIVTHMYMDIDMRMLSLLAYCRDLHKLLILLFGYDSVIIILYYVSKGKRNWGDLTGERWKKSKLTKVLLLQIHQ